MAIEKKVQDGLPRENLKLPAIKEAQSRSVDLSSLLLTEDIQKNEAKEITREEKIRDLVKEAEDSSKDIVMVLNFYDLSKKNPKLAQVIRLVADELGVPITLLYSTFNNESAFKHQMVGDTHLKNHSIGIGQFQPRTWDDISNFSEYKVFMSRYYGNRTFERGENILADIAATAVLLKIIASSGKINLEEPLDDADLVYIRCRYTGDKAKKFKAVVKSNEKDEEGNYLIPERYTKFLKTVRGYERDIAKNENLPEEKRLAEELPPAPDKNIPSAEIGLY